MKPKATAPDFTLTDTNGRTYALADGLKRGPVLLAFFKQSCPVCRFTFPFLERINQATQGVDGLQIWGISQNDADETREFAREYGCTFPFLFDREGYPVSNQYGLTNVPTLFLVNPDGSIQLSSVGFDRKDIETVAAEFGKRSGRSLTVFQPGEEIPDHRPG